MAKAHELGAKRPDAAVPVVEGTDHTSSGGNHEDETIETTLELFPLPSASDGRTRPPEVEPEEAGPLAQRLVKRLFDPPERVYQPRETENYAPPYCPGKSHCRYRITCRV